MFPHVAVIDIGIGNLHSVLQACRAADLDAALSSDRAEIASADALILPGVGAFGDAMKSLAQRDLVGTLREFSLSGRPLFGICLGMQLLMSSSEEFGHYRGLDLIRGETVRFRKPLRKDGRVEKVPHVGWSRIRRPEAPIGSDPWVGTPLEELPAAPYMHFVHSYHVQPDDPRHVMAWTTYGDVTFASAVRVRNTYGFQFHPERSGPDGISLYRGIARVIEETKLAAVA